MMTAFMTPPAEPIQTGFRRPPGGAPDGEQEFEPESSFALVLRARRGDEAALNDLFERYSKRLRVWAHGRLPPWARGPADTQDVVQDTLLQVVRKLDAFEPRHEGAFLGYVRQTLRNNITDRIRQARRRAPSNRSGLRRRQPRRRPRRKPSPRSSWTGTIARSNV